MSLPRQIEVACNRCGSKQPFTEWQTLNAELKPDAREALLKGELTRFVCAQCGASAEVLYPILYHDSDRQLMVWFVVGQSTPGAGLMPIASFMQDYQFRVVTTRHQLVEKIRIFESNLDDRLLEFAKFILRLGATNAGRPLRGELLFNGQGRTATGEAGLQFVLRSPGGPEPFTILMSHLHEYTQALADKLPSAQSEAAQWITVDEKYAANLARQL